MVVGRAALLRDLGIETLVGGRDRGRLGRPVPGALTVADTVRSTSAAAVQRLQEAGAVVAMVEDGVNAAAALTAADNVATVPLAAAGLVTPVLAAAAMALSRLFVVGNSLRLLRLRLHVSR